MQAELQTFIEIQNAIFELKEETIDSVKNQILSTFLIHSSFGIKRLVDIIYNAYKFRPKQFKNFADLCYALSLSSSSSNYLSEIKLKILKHCDPSFIYDCYCSRVFKYNEIQPQIRSFVFRSDLSFLWFAPELEINDPALLEKQLSVLGSPLLQKYRYNNWNLLKTIRSLGYDPSTIEGIISTDNIDALKSLSSDPLFDPNQIIPTNTFSRSAIPLGNISAISYAAYCSSPKCFHHLLLNGGNPYQTDEFGRNALHLAIIGGSLEVIQILTQYCFGFAGACCVAAYFHQNQILKWLIENEKCSPLEKFGVKQHSAIYECASTNNIDGMIICHFSNEDFRTSTSILLNAIERENYEVIEFLKDHNVQVNVHDNHNGTPLISAIKLGNLEMTKLLIEMGADPNMPTPRGLATPFWIASYFGHISIIKYLASLPTVNVNQADLRGITPLHAAAMNRQLVAYSYILKIPGIQKELRDCEGNLPIHLAVMNQSLNVLEFMLRNKIDLNEKTIKGETVKHLIKKTGNIAMNKLFTLYIKERI